MSDLIQNLITYLIPLVGVVIGILVYEKVVPEQAGATWDDRITSYLKKLALLISVLYGTDGAIKHTQAQKTHALEAEKVINSTPPEHREAVKTRLGMK